MGVLCVQGAFEDLCIMNVPEEPEVGNTAWRSLLSEGVAHGACVACVRFVCRRLVLEVASSFSELRAWFALFLLARA